MKRLLTLGTLRWLLPVLIIGAATTTAVAARAVTTLFTTYVAGSGFVETVDEAQVVWVDIISATSMRVRVKAVPGVTQATVSYTVRVTLDTDVTSLASVSWTAPQVAAAQEQNVTVTGLLGLLSASDWIITVTR